MSTERANRCIECSITNCEHHCTGSDFCSLDHIQVGTHEANPTMYECTDCMSFKMKG